MQRLTESVKRVTQSGKPRYDCHGTVKRISPIFALLQTRAIVTRRRQGKSGQHRATHRLSAGLLPKGGREKVPQKITTPAWPGKR